MMNLTGEHKCVWCNEAITFAEFDEYDGVHEACFDSWRELYVKNNPNNAWSRAYLAAKEQTE